MESEIVGVTSEAVAQDTGRRLNSVSFLIIPSLLPAGLRGRDGVSSGRASKANAGTASIIIQNDADQNDAHLALFTSCLPSLTNPVMAQPAFLSTALTLLLLPGTSILDCRSFSEQTTMPSFTLNPMAVPLFSTALEAYST